MWDKLDMLVDEEYVDAIELVNSAGDGDSHRFLFKWYEERIRSGRPTPIVSGLDIHAASGCQRPPVTYMPAYPPAQDIHILDIHRTVVLCESVDEKCVFDAVRKCRCLIDLNDRLIGPPALVEKLVNGGYFEKRKKAQAEREAFRVEVMGATAPVAGEPLSLRSHECEEGGVAALYADKGKPITIPFGPDGLVGLDHMPTLCGDDLFYAPVHIRPKVGGGRLFAVKTRSSLSVKLRPEVTFANGRRRDSVALEIRNNGSSPATGSYRANCEGSVWHAAGEFGPIPPLSTVRVDCGAAPTGDPHQAREFCAEITMDGGVARRSRRSLVFLGIPRSDSLSEEDWRACAPIAMDKRELLDASLTSRWDGPRDASAEIRILWNAVGLHFRVEAIDDALVPSPRRDQTMFGDSVQVGLNPIDCEDVPCFSFYDITMTRGGDGTDERCWIRTAPQLAVESVEKGGRYMPASCFSVEKIGASRTRLSLDLPWSVLVPMQPLSGYRFGLYFYLFDNDGTGLKSALTWPWPTTDRCWYIPEGADWAQAVLL